MSKRDHGPSERRPEELDRDDRQQRAEASNRLQAIQRSAGNQALSARLARAPDGPKPDVKDAEEKSESAGAAAEALLPDIGKVPLLSVQIGGAANIGNSGSGKRELTEITVTSRHGDHSSALLKAATEGAAMEVEIVLAKARIRYKLKNALITGYHVPSGDDSPVESWTLNFTSFEQSIDGKPAPP